MLKFILFTIEQKGRRPNIGKLTDLGILKIKDYLAKGFTQKKIANIFGISQTIVSKIKLGKYWSDII